MRISDWSSDVCSSDLSFAGLSKPQDRADLLLYLNAQGSNLPVPPPPAEEAAEEEPANAVEAVDDVAVSEEAPAGGSPAGAASVGLPTGATTDQAAQGNRGPALSPTRSGLTGPATSPSGSSLVPTLL